jgi:hypothetical protein
VAQGADPIYEAARFLAATRPELGVRPENLVKFEAALNSEVYLRRNQRIVVVDEVVRSGNTMRQAVAAIQDLHQKLFRCPGNVGFEVMSFRPHLGDADRESFSPLLEELSGSPLNSIFGSRISSSLSNAATYLDHFISPRGTIETVADWRNVQIRNSPSDPFENVSAEYWLRRFELISGR